MHPREGIRADLRLHRRLAIAAAEWKAGSGGLWPPPELDLLNTYRARAEKDLTADQEAFVDASQQVWQKELDREPWQRSFLGFTVRDEPGFRRRIAEGRAAGL